MAVDSTRPPGPPGEVPRDSAIKPDTAVAPLQESAAPSDEYVAPDPTLTRREAAPFDRRSPRTIDELYARISTSGVTTRDPAGLKLLLTHALENLLDVQFKPETVTAGERPTNTRMHSMVTQALRVGYRRHHGEAVSQSGREIQSLVGPFTLFVTQHAPSLGLIGIRPREARGRRTTSTDDALPSAAEASTRVLHAREVTSQIEADGRAIPAYYVETHLEAKGQPTPERLRAEAQTLSRQLTALGTDEVTVTMALRSRETRAKILKTLERLREIGDTLHFYRFEATSTPDWEGADRFMAYLDTEVNTWTTRRGAQSERALLQQLTRTYVAFWLAEQAGTRPLRLTHSQDALRLAAMSVGRDVRDRHLSARLPGLANQLVHYLVRLESRRGRMAFDPAALPPTESSLPAAPPPITRAVNNLEQLEAAIGSSLYEALDRFYAAVRDGEHGTFAPQARRREVAQNFFELFVHYIRYARNVYGDDLQQEIARRGLEPRFVQAVFVHVGNERLFDRDVLTLLRDFFSARSSSPLPSIDQLVPAGMRTAQGSTGRRAVQPTSRTRTAPDRDGFIRHEGEMGMREFLDQVPGMSAERVRRFEDEVGIDYNAFLNWGGVRRNPESLSVRDWQAMVAFAAEEDEHDPAGERLLGLLRRNRSDEIPAEAWEARLVEANVRNRLVEFANAETNRPTHVVGSEWDGYVDRLRTAGRLEDVTVAPRRTAALDAVLPAYHFMRDVAAESRRRIDFFDYLSAIHPIARRLRARIHDGRIHITVPQFMQALPYYNWGYPTWAQQVHGSDLATDVMRATLASHMRGEVEQPEYWDIRRYTVPLAASTGGGIDQERRLYEFAWLMRVAYLFDNAMEVRDSNESLLTNPSGGVESRVSLQIDDDVAEYPEGIGPPPDSHWRVFLDVRQGVFRRQLDFADTYLRAVGFLPEGTVITNPSGEPIALADLTTRLRELERQDTVFAAALADRSPMAAYRSQADRDEIYDFYLGVRHFVEELAFFTHIRGHINTPQGTVSFQTVPSTQGQEPQLIGGNHVTVPIDDLAHVASDESWPREHIDDVFRLRVLATYALARGDLSPDERLDPQALQRAVAPLWGGQLTAGTLENFVRLERERTERTGELHPTLPTVRERGEHVRDHVAPFLPERRVAPPWQEQFETLARGTGHALSADMIHHGIAALEDYFRTTRGFYRTFWPNTLRRIIRHHTPRASDADRERLFAAARAFFPTIGVAADIRVDRHIDPARAIEPQLAFWAMEDYCDLFPQEREGTTERTRVPVNLHLLTRIAEQHIEEHRESLPNRSLVIATARHRLEEYNTRANRPWWETPEADRLPHDGLLNRRLARFGEQWSGERLTPTDLDIVRRAYFRVLPNLRRREVISYDQIVVSLREVGGEDAATPPRVLFLDGFVRAQGRDLARMAALVTDGETGVGTGARAHVQPSALEALALSYALPRLTDNLPIDLHAQSHDLVGETFAPYDDITVWYGRFLRAGVARWLSTRTAVLSQRMGDIRDSIRLAGSERVNPPTSFDAFEGLVASLAGVTSFAELERTEIDARLSAELAGVRLPSESLTGMARRVYAEEVTPNRRAYEEHLAAIEVELETSVSNVARLNERSAALCAGFEPHETIATMDEATAQSFLARVQAGLETLLALQLEAEAAQHLPTRAERIIAELGRDPLQGGGTRARIESLLQSARESLESMDVRLPRWRDEVQGRLAHVKHEAEVQRMTAALQERARALSELQAESGRVLRPIAERLPTNVEDFLRVVERAPIDRPAFARARELYTTLETSTNELVAHSRQFEVSLRRLIDGEGTTPSTDALLRRALVITNAGIGAAGLAEAWSEVDTLARMASENLANAHASIAGWESDLGQYRQTLIAVEGHLAPSDARGIPSGTEVSNEDEITIGNARVSFVGEATRENMHQRALDRLAPVTTGARILSRAGGSHLISVADARRVEAWRSGPRTEPLRVTDFFSDADHGVTINAGEWDVNVFDHTHSEVDHPFVNLARTIAFATVGNSVEAELLARLATEPAMRDGEETLFNLFGTIMRHSPVGSGEEARGLVRRWALANLTDVSRAIGATALRGLTVTRPIGAGVPRPPIYGTNYSPARHDLHRRTMEQLLDRPTTTTLRLREQRQLKGVRGVIDSTEGQAYTEGRRDTLEVYDPEENRTLTLTREVLQRGGIGVDLFSRDFNHPLMVVGQLLTAYRLHADPELMELGWISGQEESDNFVRQLLEPHYATPPERMPPNSLREIQEVAVRVWQDPDRYAPAFAEPDSELAARFPETALVSAMMKAEFMEGRHDPASLTERIFSTCPGLLPAYFLIGSAFQQAGEAPEHLSNLLHPALERADPDERLAAAREMIGTVYTERRNQILDFLRADLGPGMTYARAITGFDRPWEVTNPDSWDAFSALDRLRMVLPEVFAIREDLVDRLLQVFASNLSDRASRATLERFIREFPDLRQLTLLNFMTLRVDMSVREAVDRAHREYEAAQRSSIPIDREVWLRRLVEVYTSPAHVALIREILQQPLSTSGNPAFPIVHEVTGASRKQTLAMALTGRQKPWLPEREPPSVPTTTTASYVIAKDYTAAEHARRAQTVAEALKQLQDRPKTQQIANFLHRVYSDPSLVVLGSLLSAESIGVDISLPSRYAHFAMNTTRPLVKNIEGCQPPFSLHEAQSFLRTEFDHFSRGMRDSPLGHPLYTRCDTELEKLHPEVREVGAWQIAQVMEQMEHAPIEGMESLVPIMRALPQFSGALALVALAHNTLAPVVKTEFQLFGASIRAVRKLKNDAAFLRESVPAFAERFRATYDSIAGQIRDALAREVYPGMTYARWATGREKPWQPDPATWEEMSPAERVALQKFPEPFAPTVWSNPDALLPKSDLERLDQMTEVQINERIDALGLLPSSPIGLQRMLDQAKQLLPALQKTNIENMTVVKIAYLSAQGVDHTFGFQEAMERRLRSTPSGEKQLDVLDYLKAEYEFLVHNRTQVIAAAKQNIQSSGGTSSPAPSSGGGSLPRRADVTTPSFLPHMSAGVYVSPMLAATSIPIVPTIPVL